MRSAPTLLKTCSSALLLSVILWAGSPGADPVRAAAPDVPQASPALVDPAILGTMSYRNLTVFNRGGRVTAVAGVASNEQLYYMGSTGGGVWRTTDAGTSWTNISDGFFEAGSIGAIEVASVRSERDLRRHRIGVPARQHLAGRRDVQVHRRRQDLAAHRPAQRRHDRPHQDPPDQPESRLRRGARQPLRAEQGARRLSSRDGGQTWELVHNISDRTGAVDLTMDVKNPNMLIAAMWTVERKPWSIDSGSTEGGLFRTTDGGDTWQKLTGGPAAR